MDAMNDLEELLRDELRARVDAAEAVRQDSALRLAELDMRIRRVRLRRRWTEAVLSAAAVATALSVSLSVHAPDVPGRAGPKTPGASVPLSDPAATPSGWAPVAFGNAQISVPARWRVGSRPACGRRIPGYVVLGPTSTNLVVRNPRCKQAPDMAAIQVLTGDRGQSPRWSGQVNGIRVLAVRPPARGYASYLVPALHAVVTARGPLADRVIGTLTRSPLSVVLERGPALRVPSGWRWQHFGGIRFAAPGAWRVVRSRLWFSCWDVVYPATSVDLVTASRRVLMSCAVPRDIASFMRPSHGVAVGFGRYAGLYDTASEIGCRRLHGLRACFYWPSPGRPLELAVFVPGRGRPTIVDVGLRGSGLEARTIVESIRPG
jgi:hypothetical protein